MADMTYSQEEFGPAIDRMSPTEYLLDPWSFFDFKVHFRQASQSWTGQIMPSWVPPEHHRRLKAYMMLESYYRICARRWLESGPHERKERREYGDPFLLVEAILSSVLGNDIKIMVKGAAAEDASSDLKDAQDLLDQWMLDEQFDMKVSSSERNAVKLGDGVFVLGWDEDRKRPRLRVYDPGFYFPVEDPENDDDYPNKIHIAYEYMLEDANGREQRWVRRITWELRDAVDAVALPWGNGEAPDRTCWYCDQKWLLGDARGGVEDFSPEKAVTLQDDTDLGIDFIPVVHVPNMAPDGDWGTSALASIIQLFDDIVATDTDLQSASALTGSPVIGIGNAGLPKNSQGEAVRYGPGDVFETGDGKLDMLDTSHSLDALLKMKESLLDRMSVNGRTPGTLLGRVDPAKVQSGIILTLSFAPHTTMIREMRRIRDVKYRILLKFVLRFFANDKQVAGDIPETTVLFGSYLPADKSEAATVVQLLLTAKAISRETAIGVLLEAGYSIADIKSELAKIASTDFAGADQLVTATNDTEAVREYLGLGPAPQGTTIVDQQELKTQAASDQAAALAAGAGNGNKPPQPAPSAK